MICVDIPQTFLSLTNPLNETETAIAGGEDQPRTEPGGQVVFRECFDCQKRQRPDEAGEGTQG